MERLLAASSRITAAAADAGGKQQSCGAGGIGRPSSERYVRLARHVLLLLADAAR